MASKTVTTRPMLMVWEKRRFNWLVLDLLALVGAAYVAKRLP